MTEVEELMFNTKYGCMFALQACMDYCEALIEVDDNTYVRNCCRQVGKTSQTLYKALERDVTRGMTKEQREIAMAAIEEFKNLVFEFFALNPEQQRRVQGLIHKLQRETSYANTTELQS